MVTESELAAIRPRLLGLIPEERILAISIPRPRAGVVDAFLSLGDMCSAVADALDQLAVGAAISGGTLVQRLPGSRICGPAITIRYAAEIGSVGALIARGEHARLADRDLYGVGQPGDVAVFDCGGLEGASAMGGLSSRWGRSLGIAGSVVDGAVRDLETIRSVGFPVWSRAVTPVSGKFRLRALEINGVVTVAHVAVNPGDFVLGDETGICVVPASDVESILAVCRESHESEAILTDAIDAGASPEKLARILSPDRW